MKSKSGKCLRPIFLAATDGDDDDNDDNNDGDADADADDDEVLDDKITRRSRKWVKMLARICSNQLINPNFQPPTDHLNIPLATPVNSVVTGGLEGL